jgi:hypothetical protein
VSSTTRFKISLAQPDGVTFKPFRRMDGIDVYLDSSMELWLASHRYAVIDWTPRRSRFSIGEDDPA